MSNGQRANKDITEELRPAYHNIAHRWLQWLAQAGVSLDMATESHVQQYVEYLLQNRRPSTVVKELSVIRTLYRQLIAEGKVNRSPVQHVQISLSNYRPCSRKTHTVASVGHIPETTMIGIRDRAIMRLRLIGLWPSQLVCLDVSDVNHEAQAVQIRRPNHRQEYVFLDDSVWKDVRRWLAVRELLKPETPAVFLSLHWTHGLCWLHLSSARI
jgi:site-specific recombinase XerD